MTQQAVLPASRGRRGSRGRKKSRGPEFLRYVAPIVEILRELGNSGTSGEVTDKVIERCKVPEADLEVTTGNGQPRVRNQIGWARFYLAKAGLVDASRRGVWALTEAGQKANLDADGVYELFRAVQRQFPAKPRDEATDDEDAVTDPEQVEGMDYREQLLDVLKALPPAGFERVCQRLLRESGFQQVVVEGRSGDGGIDGHGILEINPLVTFKVLFQCKRYTTHPVTAGHVRDFRGAMQGRSDKGLIITTGVFTHDARKEASREGVPPIELVDREKLVAMFERAEIGLRPKQTYELDATFFEEFRD